ncbi:MAG: DNA polymerase IV [Alphaproteobacteria bacterium]|nr:DNA polymerase IV [Alphaproteobacteria bacterium]
MTTVAALCRDCLEEFRDDVQEGRCSKCGSPRVLTHPELGALSIAHIDCDAFYASIEKRDDPTLKDRPVIVGGGHRGVVSAACYVARLYGVRSAMPMFKALKACPHAAVLRPNMSKYSAVGGEVRAIMRDYTPLVQPLSIDEAFLDLSGTESLHKGSPARTLSLIIKRIETEIGVTGSVGLSYNKFLAKVGSDLDKPRGFAMIGAAEAIEFLAPRPVKIIWGVGKALEGRLRRDGITTVGHLQKMEEDKLVKRYGVIGHRLFHFSRGHDDREVAPSSAPKSISAETTFAEDIHNLDELCRRLWPLCEKVAQRLKTRTLAGRTVTVKLKRSDFQQLTRSRTLTNATQLAEMIYRTGVAIVEKEATGPAFRLIGIGVADILDAEDADPPDLLQQGTPKDRRIEQAVDAVREKLGPDAIKKGRLIR